MIVEKTWFKNYPDEIPRNLNYDEKPLYNVLFESVLKNPKKKALYFQGNELTFEEVLTEAKKTAHYLQKNELKKGDRVERKLQNCPQAVRTYYDTVIAG